MSNQPLTPIPTPEPDDEMDARLLETARAFPYPPTPDIAGAVMLRRARLAHPVRWRRRLAWAAIILVLILAGLMAVPQVRAAVLEIIMGALRIRFGDSAPTATPALPAPTAPSGTAPATEAASLGPTPTPWRSVLNLTGETTLDRARTGLSWQIRLPTYPADLGPPDKVYRQEFAGTVVVLVWLESAPPQHVKMSLHQLGPATETFAQKGNTTLLKETTVNGQRALWIEGPHVLEYLIGGRVRTDLRRLVEGRVLVWVENRITYRLETTLPLEEAVKVAESLR
jgi:hypothetical protein